LHDMLWVQLAVIVLEVATLHGVHDRGRMAI